jgi:hypothetical protein
MPTGYVYEMLDKQQNFQEFVWTCARAFGALIMMRDDPLSAPVPKELYPDEYHQVQHESSVKELADALAMSPEQRKAFCDAERAETKGSNLDYLEEKRETNKKIRAMRKQVESWKVEPEYANFKAFMIEQLNASIENEDYFAAENKKVDQLSDEDYWKQYIERVEWSIKYHKDEYQKECQRTAERNAWLKGLQALCPIPASKQEKKNES